MTVMDDLDAMTLRHNGTTAEGVPLPRFRSTDELVEMVDVVTMCWPEDKAFFEGACIERGLSISEAVREALLEWAMR